MCRVHVMSALEKRAWLSLGSQCPPYLVYFLIQWVWPALVPDMLAHIVCLAVVAGLHAVVYMAGWLLLRRGERGESQLLDTRDRDIDGRATRQAYMLLLILMVMVGVVMPFGNHGWQLTNAALLAIVLSETVRHVLIIFGYRGAPRFAH